MRRSAAGYFFLQGASGIAWWALLLFYAPARSWFLPTWAAARLTWALLAPDVVFFVAGSFFVAILSRRGVRSLVPAALVVGATAYAALLCFGLAIESGDGWFGAVLMLGALLSGVACLPLLAGHRWIIRLFRPASDRISRRLGATAFAQTAAFWTMFLVLLPASLATLEQHAGVPTLAPNAITRGLAVAAFSVASTLGVVSAIYMVRVGRGTPLPTQSAHALIVGGPYRFVRNPMAIAGLAQGLAVALFVGSPTVVVYVVLGGLIWNVVLRPLEEHDMELRFGAEFRCYQSQVRCWLPRFPWRSAMTTTEPESSAAP